MQTNSDTRDANPVNDQALIDRCIELVRPRFPTHQQTRESYLRLAAQACITFGVNPDKEAVPPELAAIAGYGDEARYQPEYVVLVTCGGQKLQFPFTESDDDPTTEKLRRIFKCWKIETGPGRQERTVVLPLPKSLVLPEVARTGIPQPRATQRIPAWLHGGTND